MEENNDIFLAGFPKPKSLAAYVTVKLDLPNYTTKADLKKYNRFWYIRFS